MFSGRLRTGHFPHPLYGHGYQCQGGYGGTTYTVNNVSGLVAAAGNSGSKIINIATAGTYTLTEDLDINDSYVSLINTSGGNVQLTGAGLRLGTGVTDVYARDIEIRRGDIAMSAENNGDPIHVNPGCDRIYFYKMAFYEGVDDSSIRSGGVTFDLCQFGPNWDSQHNEESEGNGGTGHAFGPFSTDASTGISWIYPLFHSLEDRAPQAGKGDNLVFGFVAYNCQLGPTAGNGTDAAYCEFMHGRVKDGPATTPGLQQMGVRINGNATAHVRNVVVDGSRDSESAADSDAVFPSDVGRMVDRDPTVDRFPLPAPDTVANIYTYVLANVGPTNKSATLAAYLAQVNAGTGSILRS